MNTKEQQAKPKPVKPSSDRNREIDFLMHNLFKPPKDDTTYFYYTEVFSDWVDRK
jgi:hypothetical protein